MEKTAESYRESIRKLDERIGVLYRERRTVMEEFSDAFPPVIPAPRYRTDHQQRVARCPRCGTKLASADE